MNESETVPGDLYETPNGNRYLVLPNNQIAYLGNKIHARSEGLIQKTGAECKVLGRVRLPPYKERDDNLEDYWDDVQGVERFQAPLPNGCTCDPGSLMAVIECPVHQVSTVGRDICDEGSDWIRNKIQEKAHELLSKHFNEALELEIGLSLRGRTPSDPSLGQQNHAITITLLTGRSKRVSST